jgi:hypothetical protein
MVPECASMSATVFIPSVKSCAMTATATSVPTLGLTWKPSPIPTPSMKLCTASATALSAPTSG